MRRFASLLGDLRGPALPVLLSCLVCQLGLAFGYLYGPLLEDITRDLSLTRAEFSSARGPLLFVISFASPLVGWLVLRVGARAVLVLASLLLAVTFVFIGRAERLADLYAANVLLGLVTTGFGDITVGQVVSQWVRRGRGLALGIVYSGSNLGATLFTPLAIWLAQAYSWRVALTAIGVGGALFILPFARFGVRPAPDGVEAAAADDAPTAAPRRSGPDLTARQALRTRSFWILGFALASFFFFFLAVLEQFVVFLTDAGLSRAEAGGWFALATGMGVASKILMGFFADRMTPRLAILVDYGLLTASSLLLLLLPAQPWLWAFAVLFGFSYAARDVVTPLAISDCFGARYLATIYGTLMLVLAPAGTAGGIFAGAVFDATGAYDVAFQTFAALNLVVFASLFFLRRERV